MIKMTMIIMTATDYFCGVNGNDSGFDYGHDGKYHNYNIGVEASVGDNWEGMIVMINVLFFAFWPICVQL